MSRSLHPPTPSTPRINTVAPVNKGGTGGANVVTAAQNLGAISQSKYNQANGVAAADGSGNIPSSVLPGSAVVGPTLNGSTLLSPNQVALFEITNFDSLATYTVSASAGSIAVVGTNVQYTAPGTAGGVTITVNGKDFALVVGAARPATPSISVSLSGNPSAATATFTGSAFSEVGGAGTHHSTDWEIYSDVGMTNLVFQSQASTTNKTSWTQGGLSLSTTYYARARYRDNNSNVSDWSATLSVVTAASYVPFNTEEAKLLLSDPAATSYFGYSVAITSDGVRVAIGAFGKDGGQGAVYVFTRSGTVWSQEQKLVPSDGAANDNFGNSVAINSTGTRIAVGSRLDDATQTNQGTLYVFARSGTTWTQEQKLAANDPTTSASLGTSVAINSDGTRIVIGGSGISNGSVTCGGAYVFAYNGSTWLQEQKLLPPSADQVTNRAAGTSVAINSDATRIVMGGPGSGTLAGAVYSYTRSGSTWTFEQKFTSIDIANGDYFGQSVAFNGDATRVVVGAYQKVITNTRGAAYIFLRTGSTWAQEARIEASDGASADGFGTFVAMDSAGSRVIAGAYQNDAGAVSNSGAAYVYVRSGTTWSQEKKLSASDKTVDARFGVSMAVTPDASRLVVGSHTMTYNSMVNVGPAYLIS